MDKVDYSGKSVLVTGATGFLGGAVTRRLAKYGAHVKALVRRPNRDDYIHGIENIEQVQGDITNSDDMNLVMRDCEYVFHSAAQIGGQLSLQREVNVLGTRNVAIAAQKAGVERFVHVSTIAVYGYRHHDVITEETVQTPGKVPYNISKSEAETALKSFSESKNLSYSIVRPGMIYGERSGAWTLAMLRLARLRPTPFIGDGSGTAYPIYIQDLVDLMLLVGQHENAHNQAFNAVMTPQPTFREFIGSYMSLVGHDNWLSLPYWLIVRNAFFVDTIMNWLGETQDFRNLIPFITSSLQYSMEKAHTLLDWQPPTSLTDGMKRTAAWLIEEGYL